MNKHAIYTTQAPLPGGTYSQAIKTGNTIYLAGQIPVNPHTGELIEGAEAQVDQVFKNIITVVEAAGGSVDHIVKLTVYLTDLDYFPLINATMAKYFHEPYPARTTIEVSALPKDTIIEVDAIAVINSP